MFIKKVYFDLDGVCFDFVQGIEQLTGQSIEQLTSDYEGFELLKKEISNTDFFKNLLPMGGLQLIRDLKDKNIDVAILTSCSRANPEHVALMKRICLENNGFGDIEFNYTICSEDKALYANNNVLLVDDRMKAIKPFVNNGGHAVQYFDYESCKQELYKYLKL